MNAIALDTQKVALARDILDEPNESIITMLTTYFREMKDDSTVPPCCFSVAELKSEITESLNDVVRSRVTTQEQLEKEMMLW
jgi:hypothetical protein